MRPSSLRRLCAVGFTLLLFPTLSFGAAFSIAPTRVQLGDGQTTGSVTLTNNSDATVTVQVETFAWRRSESIGDLDPTRDLIAVPPFFDIEPGADQIIRVGLRGNQQSEVEQAYRLVLSEVPATDPDSNLGIQFALRLSLPIFLTPEGASPDAQWQARRAVRGLQLGMSNSGQAHLRIFSLKIEDPQARQLAEYNQPLYLLAGQTRDLNIELDAPLRSEAIRIVAQTNDGAVEVTTPVIP